MYRRQFMQRLALGAAAFGSGLPLAWPDVSKAREAPVDLTITDRTIEVNGRPAKVFGLVGPNGKPGLTLNASDPFDVRLTNNSSDATLIHWHGLTPPWLMDGVPDNPAPMIAAGGRRRYSFPLRSSGTHWMHAHTLQEQNLLAAPLIIRTEDDRRADVQDVVLLLHDFSFRAPEELLASLKSESSKPHDGMGNMKGMGNMPAMGGRSRPTSKGQAMDLNDIDYEAYLANDRTLDDPEIVSVEKGGRVRLRIINGAAATNFMIGTGVLQGRLIEVDGQSVQPVVSSGFGVSMGQRLDILLDLSADGGSFPVLALREGARERTGIVLATSGAPVVKLDTVGPRNGPVLDLALESRLRAFPEPKALMPTHTFDLTLSGSMSGYTWQIGGAEQLNVKSGERIQMVMRNMSMMGHPMHLHGHHFQVVAINDKAINGALRDTVYVPPGAKVAIAFSADNRGRWPFHCHHLYHMKTGMFSYIRYDEPF